ncbi:MAG TPA: DivIVA domain-containing protein [Thermoanaerobaculia bacterium]|nr:DivIVA domain-containing protein [Thermoanaerobaculia bacterium]
MQDLSPLEIQKQTFGKEMRGYGVDEVRAYLHMVAEEVERLLKDVDRLSRENALLREHVAEQSEREQILKDTLLSAQRVSEELKQNARKESELIVKDAELLSDRLMSQAMERVADLERKIGDLKLMRKEIRNKVHGTLDAFEQMIAMDSEQESNELPITQLYRRSQEAG